MIGLLKSMAFADMVVFKTGEVLKGKVISVADGKMVFKSKVVGSATFSVNDIKECITEDPVELLMKDGSVLQQPVQIQPGSCTGTVDVVISDGTVFSMEEIEKVNPEKKKWSGSILANYLENQGNLMSRTVSVTGEAVRRGADTRLSMNAGYFYGEQEDTKTSAETTTADNIFVGGKFDYFFTKHIYSYVSLKYYRDSVIFVDYRLSGGLGMGYQWIETTAWKFNTEIGLIGVREKYWDPNEVNDYLGSRLAYHIDYKLSEMLSAFHNLELVVNAGSVMRYLLSTDAGINAKLTTSWFAQGKLQMLYDSAPPGNHELVDSRYMVGLGYNF